MYKAKLEWKLQFQKHAIYDKVYLIFWYFRQSISIKLNHFVVAHPQI